MQYYAMISGECIYLGTYETWDELEDNVSAGQYDSFHWIFCREDLSKFVEQASELMERWNA